MCSIRY
jgi:hypothetical protein